MNLKQEAAKHAVTLINNHVTVGLGAGATMAYMTEYLKALQLPVQLYTSSADTKALLQQNGFKVNAIAGIASLDIYFDGCDQFDKDLNALKSGGGIHTAEKLLAAMAKEFVLVGDESKYADQLTTKYPLVLEVLPQALHYVMGKVHQMFNGITVDVRQNADNNRIITENGNNLADIWFAASWPELSQLNPALKGITGVVETSLFYNMADKAIMAGITGVQVLKKKIR
jgi:ribose 5-phosphate isomerase A